jgi:predicted ABC-type ATPase
VEIDMKSIFIFAGPNGSGKSTVVDDYISSKLCPENYICPDNFVAAEDKDKLEPYIAAMQMAEAIRYQEVALGHSFCFETVLSNAEKINFIRYAKRQGYEIHIIYITTSSPEINIARVKERVEQGGHDVPTDKIISRYEKSMQLMFDVISESDTARIYDNSDTEPVLVCAKFENRLSIIENPPGWMDKYILSKLKKQG